MTEPHTARAAPPPLVDVIEAHDAFTALKPAWNALYLADPLATVFLSWDWLDGALRDNPRRWRIYVARNPGNPAQIVGILPLRLRVHWSRDREEFTTELVAAGRLLHSVYTGFLCAPGWEASALAAIAGQVAQAPWAELAMRYVPQQGRAQLFASSFPGTEFKLSWRHYFVDDGQTDNLLCPQIVLPDSFESYLQTRAKPDVAARIRKFQRRYLDSGQWRESRADAATLSRDLDILAGIRAGGAAQADAAATGRADKMRRSLMQAHALGCLHLCVLWSGDTPLGALAHVLDHNMDRMHVVLGGAGTGPAAGAVDLLLHARGIRWAIDNGFGTYDFGPGNRPETYGFGARDRQVHYFVLRRRMLPRAFALDRLSLPDAVARVAEMVAANRPARAAKALEQLRKLV